VECYLRDVIEGHRDVSVSYKGERDGGHVFECPDCGLVFSPQLNSDEYLRMYKDHGRYFQESVGVGYSSFEERFEHDYEISEVRVKNMREVSTSEPGTTRVLDVGCGNCALTRRLTDFGYRVEGVDLDAFSLKMSSHLPVWRNNPPNVHNVDFIDLKSPHRFDVIMFTDSFEHFLYPLTCVNKVEDLLSEGGIVVVEMPDTDCDGWRTLGVEWRHVKPKEHPFLYNLGHVREMFATIGLSLRRALFTIPGRAVLMLGE